MLPLLIRMTTVTRVEGTTCLGGVVGLSDAVLLH